MGMFTGNLSQPLLAAAVLRWLGHRVTVLETLKGATAFVLVAALAAPAVASTLSAFVLSATGWAPSFCAHWRMRFVTNVLSTLSTAPPILTLLHRRALPRPFLPHTAEFLLLLAMLTASERLVGRWQHRSPYRPCCLRRCHFPLGRHPFRDGRPGRRAVLHGALPVLCRNASRPRARESA
jgi:hypothetical protein